MLACFSEAAQCPSQRKCVKKLLTGVRVCECVDTCSFKPGLIQDNMSTHGHRIRSEMRQWDDWLRSSSSSAAILSAQCSVCLSQWATKVNTVPSYHTDAWWSLEREGGFQVMTHSRPLSWWIMGQKQTMWPSIPYINLHCLCFPLSSSAQFLLMLIFILSVLFFSIFQAPSELVK